ncbi:TRAP transporter substrate-binding protein [Blastococcus sp. CT_GayMR20]|uniref:TRAP transporter substrate-binding protein n=1 Tax=Blastococcus sp. CT_GayMR20 TaxID=2559609 RepID=UPI0014313F67|nr:TRAP transporter substrate-binding protein [Blastococcus sp. CT_GayMR20]
MRLAHCCADGSHFDTVSEKFAELVTEKTDGAITIEVFPGAQLGAEKEVVENVQAGAIEMTMVSSDPLGGFASEVQVLSQPYVFDDPEHAFRVLDGEVGDQLEAALLDKGLLVLGWGDNGQRVYTNNDRPILEPSDVEGLKIRSPQSPVNLAITEALGGSGVAMAYGEVYTGLQQGTIDGQENAIINIYPAKLQEVQRYLSLTNHLMSFVVAAVNPQWFDGLTPETQEAIREAATEAMEFEREQTAELTADLTEKLEAEGMQIDEPDVDAFREQTQDLYKEFVGEAFTQELYDAIRSER